MKAPSVPIVAATVGALFLAAGCASRHSAGTVENRPGCHSLRGEVVYKDRLLLPGDAVTYVTLRESDADGESTVASTRVDSCISSPLPFNLTFESAALDPRAEHSIQTEIVVDGERRFVGREEVSIGEVTERRAFVEVVANMVP